MASPIDLHSASDSVQPQNMRYDRGVFQFKYSSDDLEKVLEFFNEFQSDEYNKLNSLFNYIAETELPFKRSNEEVSDITAAVRLAVGSFTASVQKEVPVLEVSDIALVGSVADNTKIVEPNEFDFLITLKGIGDHIKIEVIEHEDIYLPCEYSEGQRFFRAHADIPECSLHRHIPVPSEIKCTSEFSDAYKHVHVKLEPKTLSEESQRVPESWRTNGYVCSWQSLLFYNENSYRFKWQFEKTTEFGTLRSYPEEAIEQNGPAVSLKLRWEPNAGKPLDISVDVVYAIEVKGMDIGRVSPGDINNVYLGALRNTDKYLILPSNISDRCFKFSFIFTEMTLFENLSAVHKRCYTILKYLFQCHLYQDTTMFQSYILKRFVFHHAENCEEANESKTAKCVINILKVLRLGCCWGEYIVNSLTVENLFIPSKQVEAYVFTDRLLLHVAECLHKTSKLPGTDVQGSFGYFRQLMNQLQALSSIDVTPYLPVFELLDSLLHKLSGISSWSSSINFYWQYVRSLIE